jgi:hypothetical protein
MSAAKFETIAAPLKKVGSANTWKVDAAGIGALLALSAAAYYLGVLPALERHDRGAAQMAELTEARQKALDAEKMLETTKKQLALTKGEVAASPLQLQPLGQLNHRLAMVADIAARSGATLDDVQPGKPILAARLDTQPVHVAGVASFPSFAGLMHRIRQEMPDSGINGFDLTIPNPTGTGPNAKFDFEMTWYARPTPRPAGAADGANAKK